MKDTEALSLLKKYRAGLCTEEERAQLEGWYLQWNEAQAQSLAEDELMAIREEMWVAMPKAASTHKKMWPGSGTSPIRKSGSLATLWKVAAAVAVVTLGIWLYYASSLYSPSSRTAGRDLYANDIAPGRNTATITFDNGEVVSLNKEELDISSESVEPLKEGSEVSSETPQFLASRISRSKTVVLSTPRAGTYHVVLPDGSKVWLNADTKIEFPSKFIGRERKVLLTSGEAYFEVSKNKAKPFIVESKGQEVIVLGTHFNISAYPEEGSTKTTLLEGSVNVNGKILVPNQQAVLTASNTIQVKKIDPVEIIAWKQGYFRFSNTKIRDIMQQVARWYDIEVVYEGKTTEEGLYGKISRYKNITEVLKMLEKTGLVRFKIEGRRVIVRE